MKESIMANLMKKKLATISNNKSKQGSLVIKRATTNSTDEEILEKIEKRDKKERIKLTDPIDGSNFDYESYTNIETYASQNSDENSKDTGLKQDKRINKRIDSTHYSLIGSNEERMNKVINQRNSINKLVAENISYKDSNYFAYDECLSKKRTIIKKMQSPQRNKYYRGKLKHILLPDSKINDEDFKEKLIDILRQNISETRKRNDAISKALSNKGLGSIKTSKLNSKNDIKLGEKRVIHEEVSKYESDVSVNKSLNSINKKNLLKNTYKKKFENV